MNCLYLYEIILCPFVAIFSFLGIHLYILFIGLTFEQNQVQSNMFKHILSVVTLRNLWLSISIFTTSSETIFSVQKSPKCTD